METKCTISMATIQLDKPTTLWVTIQQRQQPKTKQKSSATNLVPTTKTKEKSCSTNLVSPPIHNT